MTEPQKSESTGTFVAIGAGLLAVVCCVGPVLIAGGLLTGAGGVLRTARSH